MKNFLAIASTVLFATALPGCGQLEQADISSSNVASVDSQSVEKELEREVEEEGLGVAASCQARVKSARKKAAEAANQAGQLESRRQGYFAIVRNSPNTSSYERGQIEILTRQILQLLATRDAYLAIVKKGCK